MAVSAGLMYDAVIIGAGPAGCAAALACLKSGLRVLVVAGKMRRKEQSILRIESVHPGVITLLNQIEAADAVMAASVGTYYGIEVNGAYNILGKDDEGLWQGHHIDRQIFDDALLQNTVVCGAHICDTSNAAAIIMHNDRVAGVTMDDGLDISCRYIIDASGHRCFAGRALGLQATFFSRPLPVWTGICINVPPDICPPNKAIFTSEADGWAWMAGLDDGNCVWTRLAAKGKRQQLQPDALLSYSLAAPIHATNRRWRAFRPVCTEGVLLCGDAAGVIDPAAGQGILNAVLSGIQAAKTAISCLAHPMFEAMYLARYDEWFISNYTEKVKRLKHIYGKEGLDAISK